MWCAPKPALLSALAGMDFERGLHACCQGFAATARFISPRHFIGFTATVLIVRWHRDVGPRTLSVMPG